MTRVGRDRDRRRQPRDQRAAQRRSGNLRDGVDGLALAVGVEEPLAGDEVGDEHVVGEVIQHGRDAGDDGDGIQQGQRDATRKRRDGNRQQRDGAHEVGADHQRPAAVAIDDAAAEPREDRAGERQRDREQAEIERAGAHGDDRRDRQRRARDPRADGRDALRAPQQQKIAVTQEAAARPPSGARGRPNRSP